MQPVITDFIVVDDSRLDCIISEKIIKHTGRAGFVRCFAEATEALEFIEQSPVRDTGNKAIIFLDIQMPVMDGFAFAGAFENLSDEQKAGYALFMVSSSTNETDRIRTGQYPCVRNLYQKPLTKNTITNLVDQVLAAG